jgi:hypothetical protein
LGSTIKISAKTKVLEAFIPILIIVTGTFYYLSGSSAATELVAKLQGASICLQLIILGSIAQLGYISCLDLQQRFCCINKAIFKLQEVLRTNYFLTSVQCTVIRLFPLAEKSDSAFDVEKSLDKGKRDNYQSFATLFCKTFLCARLREQHF